MYELIEWMRFTNSLLSRAEKSWIIIFIYGQVILPPIAGECGLTEREICVEL